MGHTVWYDKLCHLKGWMGFLVQRGIGWDFGVIWFGKHGD